MNFWNHYGLCAAGCGAHITPVLGKTIVCPRCPLPASRKEASMTRDDQGTAITHATLTDWPRCPECGDKIINPGAHAERCTGKPHRKSQDLVRSCDCECAPGWRHDPECPEVTG